MRLFVAIDLPERLKQRLVLLRDPAVPRARWVAEPELHITLRFIGDDLTHDDADTYADALNSVRAAPFPLTVAGVGQFPPNPSKPPRTLYAGLEASPPLRALKHQVDDALRAAGLPRADEDYHPHITLARLTPQPPASEAHRFVARNAELSDVPFTVRAFHLYNSELTSRGPRYTQIADYPLDGDPA